MFALRLSMSLFVRPTLRSDDEADAEDIEEDARVLFFWAFCSMLDVDGEAAGGGDIASAAARRDV